MSYMCLHLFEYLIYFEITLPAIFFKGDNSCCWYEDCFIFSHSDCVFQFIVKPYKMLKKIVIYISLTCILMSNEKPWAFKHYCVIVKLWSTLYIIIESMSCLITKVLFTWSLYLISLFPTCLALNRSNQLKCTSNSICILNWK